MTRHVTLYNSKLDKRTTVVVTTLHAESIGARAKNAVADWVTSVPLDWDVETIEEIPAP